MPLILRAGTYELDFDDLYARIWHIATADSANGSRLYDPAPRESLKWIIADLAGTPAESGRTMSANNDIRKQVHHVLEKEGWARRLNETSFRLLRPPTLLDGFAAVHQVMSIIPEGRWTTYGDLGSVVEVHSRGLGSHIKNCPRCPNAVRVLTSGGQRHGDGFRWSDPERTDDPNEILEREGIEFKKGRASPDQYLPADELAHLWEARRSNQEVFAWPTIEWVKVPVDRESEEPNGSPIRMRHFLDCAHWFRSNEGRLLGEPPRLASNDQMRELPACLTCVAKAQGANNPPFGPRMPADFLVWVPVADTGLTPETPDAATDATALVAVRREQRFLRSHLLGGRTEAPCALCGSVLPQGLLVAAHIAPRRTLSHAERLDFTSAAMLACVLGCDALFEHGYVVVDDTGLLVAQREAKNEAVSGRVAKIAGRTVAGFSTATAARFLSHRKLHQS